MCVTGRDNTSADINQVTAIAASGLTFTRIFHDVSFTYSDTAGDPSFPDASISVDVFTAPAPTTLTALAWTATMAGDGFVNHGTWSQFSVVGLPDLSNPFDPNVLVPVTAKNVSGTSSAAAVPGVTTTNSNDLLVGLFVNHDFNAAVTPSPAAGWTTIVGPRQDNGGASGHWQLPVSKNFSAPQTGLTVPTGFSDDYWYGAVFAFTSDSGAAPSGTPEPVIIIMQ